MIREVHVKPLLSIVVTAALLASGSVEAAQKPPVNPAAQAMADFNDRVQNYIALRNKVDNAASTPKPSQDAEHVRATQVALAEQLKRARASAKQGDIFTPVVSTHIKQILRPETADKGTKDAIKDDNPGAIAFKVNDPYPDKAPLSSMPVNVLQALPKLPEKQDLDYRFVGKHLILLDSRANIILDYIPNAIP